MMYLPSLVPPFGPFTFGTVPNMTGRSGSDFIGPLGPFSFFSAASKRGAPRQTERGSEYYSDAQSE